MGPSERIDNRRRIVLAAGVFDLLHLGHVRFLEAAKKCGGDGAILVVVVARDRTVEKRKRERPVMSENQRRALVEALEVVDEAILGYEDFSIEKVVERFSPDIIALGHDQKSIEETLRKTTIGESSKIRICVVNKFSEDELNSSSEIKKKIIEIFKRNNA
ncbi:FAD synthase [Candidatus Bathyarchaeota archaeon]|nr:FAD synthase [Candidatus Bathyarchaeota archaeon]